MFLIISIFTILIILLVIYQFHWWKSTPEGKKELTSIKNNFIPSDKVYEKEIADGNVIVLPAKIMHIPNGVLTVILLMLFGGFLFVKWSYFDSCGIFFGYHLSFLEDLLLIIVITFLTLLIVFRYWRERSVLKQASFFPNPHNPKWFSDQICRKVDDKLIKENNKSSLFFIVFCVFQMFFIYQSSNISGLNLKESHTTYIQDCVSENSHTQDP